MRAIVLVGGQGTRLRPLTWRTAKPLVPIAGRPLLAHLLLHLHAHGVNRVTLAMTERSEAIEAALGDGAALGIALTYVYEPEPRGSGGAIAGAAAGWDEPFLVMNGDTITDCNISGMVAAHHERGAELSIALHEVDDPSGFGVVALGPDGRITRFVEKPPRAEAPSRLVNAGIWYFEPTLLRELDADRFHRVEDELFPRMAEAGRGIYGYHEQRYWADVGNPEAYLRVTLDLLQGAVPARLPADWPPDALATAEATVDAAALLSPPVLLGRGTIVEPGAVLRGPLAVGEECSIERGAVVERSILWDGVTVGAGAVVRDTILATDATVEPGARIDGAVVAHEATITAGSACPPGTRVEPGATFPLPPQRRSSAGHRRGRTTPVTEIRFGTDGWRAVIAEDYTFGHVRAVTQATCEYLQREGLADREIVVGYDTRFLSGSFAGAAAEVLAANDFRVALTADPTPTPAVSHAVIERGAGFGIVITASHNPARWNGFKVKPAYGGSAPPAITSQIERLVPAVLESGRVQQMALGEAEAKGLVERFDAQPAYIARVREFVDIEAIRAAGLHLLVDPMYGAAQGWFADLLGSGATTVQEIHGVRNPSFPGMRAPEPIASNLTDALSRMEGGGYDAAFAFDGDGDRFGLIDEHGRFLSQLQTFALLVRYFLEDRGERGALVRSVTSTRMIDRLGEIYGCEVAETPVGFTHIGPRMMELDALVAGEESGGYAFRGHIPERDGLLSGLYLLDHMVRTGKRPSELLADLYAAVGPHEYHRVDVTLRGDEREHIIQRVSEADPDTIAGLPVVGRDAVDGFRFTMEGGWWLLLRFSGTEPLLRIYAEMPTAELVQQALEAGQALAGTQL